VGPRTPEVPTRISPEDTLDSQSSETLSLQNALGALRWPILSVRGLIRAKKIHEDLRDREVERFQRPPCYRAYTAYSSPNVSLARV